MPVHGRDQDRRLHELADEQAALRRVATLVAGRPSPEEIFQVVSEEVGRLFGVEATVGRYEPGGSALVVVGQTPGIPVVGVGDRWELDSNLATTEVYRTGRPARNDWTGLQDAAGPSAERLRKMDFTSTVVAPIVVEDVLWGVLAVSHRRERLGPDTEERLERFTELVGTAIANAESRAELAASEAQAHDLAREQAALRRVATRVAEGANADDLFAAVAQEVADIVGLPVVGVHRFEDDRTFTTVGVAGETSFTVGSRWPVIDEGLAGMILATGRPARKEDYTSLPGPLGEAVRRDTMIATVGAPIVADGRIWGMLVGTARPGGAIPDGIEQRFARFTQLVATAIANAQAREHVTRLATEQAALRRVATLVAQDVPATELFDAVAREVGTLLGADLSAVILYESDSTIGRTVATWAAVGEHPPAPDHWRLVRGEHAAMVADAGKPVRIDDWMRVPGLIAEYVRGELHAKSSVASPIVVQDHLWGVLVVHSTSDPLPPDTESRLWNFTELVATAIANTKAREEVAASRARVIAAADDARRRIERNLHDGAQQRLVTLGMALRAFQATLPADSTGLRAEVARIENSLATAVQELRELSRGIHPAVLTRGGLVPALKALRRRSTLRVDLDVRFGHRLPEPAETAAYYTVSEALTNASRHANATRMWIGLHVTDHTLHLSIRDDGVGGADASRGSGLTGLKDRIEAVGGTIEIESPQGDGTRIEVEIPIGASPA